MATSLANITPEASAYKSRLENRDHRSRLQKNIFYSALSAISVVKIRMTFDKVLGFAKCASLTKIVRDVPQPNLPIGFTVYPFAMLRSKERSLMTKKL